MILSWLPIIWIDIVGSVLTLLLAAFCLRYSLRLLKKKEDQTFFNYLFLLTLSFVFFAVSRSFGHLVKQTLFFYNQQEIWQAMAPFSGSINTAAFIVIFSFGIYFHRSRQIYKELERHKTHLASLVSERTEKLEKTVSEFSAVMDAIDYGILFMDDQLKARITNQAFRELWGIPEKFINRHPRLRQLIEYNRLNNLYDVPDEDFDRYIVEREAEVRRGVIKPVDLTRRDGTILQYQCIVLPDGWRMLTYFDITELKNTQKKLTQSQKMEAIGLMAGGVAHDLNNILTGVVSYPDLLLRKLPEDSELRRPLKIIQDSGQRAAEVVADLLTVARGVASHRNVCSLHTLIIEYLQSPEGVKMLSLFPDVRVELDFTSESTNILCSAVHIKKCLMNLLTNGCESISGTGTIHIETRVCSIDQPLPGNDAMQPGEYIAVRITDTGQGISERDIQHVFEPFYSKKVMGRSGTGLGLAIVWNTVHEHEGGITVTSSIEGTCFTLYFPVAVGVSGADEQRQSIEELQGSGELILVVDDEEQTREIAAQMLTTLGYQVETVSSGEEAVERVKAQDVDLLVLDMLMDPGINGRQTFERIVAFQPGQRAIITSGFSENEEVRKAAALGSIHFVRKPYTLDQLGSAVQRALV